MAARPDIRRSSRRREVEEDELLSEEVSQSIPYSDESEYTEEYTEDYTDEFTDDVSEGYSHESQSDMHMHLNPNQAALHSTDKHRHRFAKQGSQTVHLASAPNKQARQNQDAFQTPDLHKILAAAGATARDAVGTNKAQEIETPSKADGKVLRAAVMSSDMKPVIGPEPEKSIIAFVIAGTRAEILRKYSETDEKGNVIALMLPYPKKHGAVEILTADLYRDFKNTLSGKPSFDLSRIAIVSMKHTTENGLGLPVLIQSAEKRLNVSPVVVDNETDPSLLKVMDIVSDSAVDKPLFTLHPNFAQSEVMRLYFLQHIRDDDITVVHDELADHIHGKKNLIGVKRSTAFHHFLARNVQDEHLSTMGAVTIGGTSYDAFEAEELARWQNKYNKIVAAIPDYDPATALQLRLLSVDRGLSLKSWSDEAPNERVTFTLKLTVQWYAHPQRTAVFALLPASAPAPSREDIAKAKKAEYERMVQASTSTSVSVASVQK